MSFVVWISTALVQDEFGTRGLSQPIVAGDSCIFASGSLILDGRSQYVPVLAARAGCITLAGAFV